jgi:hypothetical protein
MHRAIALLRSPAGLVVILSVVLDIAGGIAFAITDHIAAWTGLYFATTTASTVGYGDITPHGWGPHLIAVGIMLTVIPLVSALFSLFTTQLTAKHVDKRHDELKDHLNLQHEAMKRHIGVHCGHGRPSSDPRVDSESDRSERSAGAEHVGGVPGHDQPPATAGDPEGPGI